MKQKLMVHATDTMELMSSVPAPGTEVVIYDRTNWARWAGSVTLVVWWLLGLLVIVGWATPVAAGVWAVLVFVAWTGSYFAFVPTRLAISEEMLTFRRRGRSISIRPVEVDELRRSARLGGGLNLQIRAPQARVKLSVPFIEGRSSEGMVMLRAFCWRAQGPRLGSFDQAVYAGMSAPSPASGPASSARAGAPDYVPDVGHARLVHKKGWWPIAVGAAIGLYAVVGVLRVLIG
jgi:hypothetical protein